MAVAVSGAQTAALIAALRARSGFSADAVAPERVASFLALRARELGLARAEDAAERALSDRSEFARLEAHFAPPETWLFRYPESFGFLRAFARERTARGVRALVVGAGGWCEPCSIAAALLDGIGESAASRVSVEAVDRNAAVFAQSPVFRAMDLRAGVPPFATRFFLSEGDAMRPAAALMRVIRARPMSAEARIEESRSTTTRFDVIAFRNVAIYLEQGARNAIFAALAALLEPDGVLLVGHAEATAAAAATGLVPDATAGAFALRHSERAAQPAPQRVAAPSEPLRRGSMKSTPLPPDAPEPDEESRARSAVSARPSDPRLHLALARILDARGDRDGAREAVGRALYLDRNLEEALVMGSRLAAECGNDVEAEHLRMRALRVHLDRARTERGA